MGGFGHKFYGYKPPGLDSPRARANATLFLVNCVTLKNVTAETLTSFYHLKPATAAAMLAEETKRREASDA